MSTHKPATATSARWGDRGCHEGEVFVLWAQPDPFPDTIYRSAVSLPCSSSSGTQLLPLSLFLPILPHHG